MASSVAGQGWFRLSPMNSKAAKPGFLTIPPADDSMAGIAAQFLRRYYCTVYHCDKQGVFELGGKYWRLSNMFPLTDERVIELAREKGIAERNLAYAYNYRPLGH